MTSDLMGQKYISREYDLTYCDMGLPDATYTA